jgi:hypothetical protein
MPVRHLSGSIRSKNLRHEAAQRLQIERDNGAGPVVRTPMGGK